MLLAWNGARMEKEMCSKARETARGNEVREQRGGKREEILFMGRLDGWVPACHA